MRTHLFAVSLLALSSRAFAQEAVTTPEPTAPETTPPTTSQPPKEAHSSPLLFSADGPGLGETRWGIGGRLEGAIPLVDVGFAYGATENLTIEMRASGIAVPLGRVAAGQGLFEPGVRYQVMEKDNFFLALHGGALLAATGAINPDDAGSVFTVRLNPGVLASIEKPRRTFSFGLDATLSLAEGGVGFSDSGPILVQQATNFSPGFNSSFTIEKPLSSGKALYTQLQVQTLIIEDTAIFPLPFLSVGVSF